MQINEVMGLLTSSRIDWGHVLANPRFIRNGNTITWINSSNPMLGNPVLPEDIAELAEKGQYSFQVVADGSLIQIFYEFENNGSTLKSASLGYYNAGTTIYAPTIPNFVNWLRFDYDPSAKLKGFLHHDCHLHLSYFPNSRLAVKGIPNPKQFIEFVMSACYPDIYRDHRLDTSGKFKDIAKQISINTPCIIPKEEDWYHHLTHLYVPYQFEYVKRKKTRK